MRKLATFRDITDIIPIPDADSIECAIVDGGCFYVGYHINREDAENHLISKSGLDENFIEESLKDACWKGYTAVGMKMKNGRKVPNCVPVKEGVNDSPKSTEEKSTKTSFKVETPWVHSQTSTGNVTDKAGHVHTPYSRARHLARQALAQMQKEDTYPGLEKEPKKGLPTAVVKTSKTAVKSDTVEGWDHPHKAVNKESYDEEGNLITMPKTFQQFMEAMTAT